MAGTIQRLQQILPPTLLEVKEIEPLNLDGDGITFEGCFKVTRTAGKIFYACLAPACILATDSAEIFTRHCRHAHPNICVDMACRLCDVKGARWVFWVGLKRFF